MITEHQKEKMLREAAYISEQISSDHQLVWYLDSLRNRKEGSFHNTEAAWLHYLGFLSQYNLDHQQYVDIVEKSKRLFEAGYNWFGYSFVHALWWTPDEKEDSLDDIDEALEHYQTFLTSINLEHKEYVTMRNDLLSYGFNLETSSPSSRWIYPRLGLKYNTIQIAYKICELMKIGDQEKRIRENNLTSATKAVVKLIWIKEFLTDVVSHIGNVAFHEDANEYEEREKFKQLSMKIASLKNYDIEKLIEEILEFTHFTRDDLDIK